DYYCAMWHSSVLGIF
nr:immunoglobulin light chain junction region [Macaca mulatta]MOX79794.1 immunoglobulin light chain junction region [Macaca mulatta]MOX80019.1 immunoglobulin light chain junction region [Macaca mulatta]MOX80408.1 immunoglobulin light chain junction region [Macaca mulatta]MOX80645.1 immunoglobulin light chain junction region [Macaca mulatta]